MTKWSIAFIIDWTHLLSLIIAFSIYLLSRHEKLAKQHWRTLISVKCCIWVVRSCSKEAAIVYTFVVSTVWIAITGVWIQGLGRYPRFLWLYWKVATLREFRKTWIKTKRKTTDALTDQDWGSGDDNSIWNNQWSRGLDIAHTSNRVKAWIYDLSSITPGVPDSSSRVSGIR